MKQRFVVTLFLTLMVVMMTGCGGKAKATVQIDHYPGGVEEIGIEEIETEEIEVEKIEEEGEQKSKFGGSTKILPW